jgi:hypothetical protein
MFEDKVIHTGDVMLSDSPHAFREILCNWLSVYENKTGLTATEAESAKQTLWRVFCADLLCHPLSSDARKFFRRAGSESELMLVTWALLLEKSPFHDDVATLEAYISDTARTWARFLALETSILTRTTEQAVWNNFILLFPDSKERQALLYAAYDSSGVHVSDKESMNESFECAAAMTDEELRQLARSQGARTEAAEMEFVRTEKQSRNCVKVPWSEVLEIARPGLLERLGPGAQVVSVSKDRQVSVMDHSIGCATNGRRLFITAHGVGLGPAELARGDKVYILRGGRTPFILRFVRSTAISSWPKRYIVTGDRGYDRVLWDDGDYEASWRHDEYRVIWEGDDYKLTHDCGQLQFVYKYNNYKVAMNSDDRVIGDCDDYQVIGDCYVHGLMDANRLCSEANIIALV